jgi:hypothetical protein
MAMATRTGRAGGGQKRGRENASTAVARRGAKRAKLLAPSGPTLERQAESVATAGCNSPL